MTSALDFLPFGTSLEHKENCKKEQDTSSNPTSPKEMWIPCLSLIKNNFGKRPIDTFPAKREMRGKKEAVEEEEEEERRAERKRKKREKFDDISKSVPVCVCDGSRTAIPMASYSSPDVATDCSDVLILTI